MVSKKLLASVVVYTIGAVYDYLLTYEYVVVKGEFVELNPFMKNFIYTAPLWMWFLRDFLFLGIIVAFALGLRYLILSSSKNEPPMVKAKLERIASKYWVIVAAVAVVRLLPGIHNTLLIVFGFETPLNHLFMMF